MRQEFPLYSIWQETNFPPSMQGEVRLHNHNVELRRVLCEMCSGTGNGHELYFKYLRCPKCSGRGYLGPDDTLYTGGWGYLPSRSLLGRSPHRHYFDPKTTTSLCGIWETFGYRWRVGEPYPEEPDERDYDPDNCKRCYRVLYKRRGYATQLRLSGM